MADCDSCSKTAEFWCESCSTLICQDHFVDHKTHEVGPLEQDDEEEQQGIDDDINDDSGDENERAKKAQQAAANITKDTEIDLFNNDDDDFIVSPDQQKKQKKKNSSSSSTNKFNKEHQHQSDNKLLVSEEKFQNVVSMLEDSPLTVCRRLILPQFLATSRTTKKKEDHESTASSSCFIDYRDEQLSSSSSEQEQLFSSLANNGFVVLNNFQKESIFDAAAKNNHQLNSLFIPSSSSSTSQLGQRGDFVINNTSLRNLIFPNSPELTNIYKNEISSKLGRSCLKNGLKIFEKEGTNDDDDEYELWKFSSLSSSPNSSSTRRSKLRDSVPNDGRLGRVKGMLGRRVSVVLFLEDSKKFLWKVIKEKQEEEEVMIDVKKGRALVFLSGAIETQVIEKQEEGEKTEDEEKSLICAAAWFR